MTTTIQPHDVTAFRFTAADEQKVLDRAAALGQAFPPPVRDARQLVAELAAVISCTPADLRPVERDWIRVHGFAAFVAAANLAAESGR